MVNHYPTSWNLGPLQEVGRVYTKYLQSIDWNDPLYVRGITEGKGKYLSNAWLAACKGTKHHKTHFVSKHALIKIRNKAKNGLVCEHMVPKNLYQKKFEILATSSELNFNHVHQILRQYWVLASITKEENAIFRDLGLTTSMPENWDEKDVFARYRLARIDLIPNPFFQD
jgi:hypothetical protein